MLDKLNENVFAIEVKFGLASSLLHLTRPDRPRLTQSLSLVVLKINLIMVEYVKDF